MLQPLQLSDAPRRSADPTGTAGLRRSFRAAAEMQLRSLGALLRAGVVDHDILGLGDPVAAGYMFSPPAERLRRFNAWFSAEAGRSISGPWFDPWVVKALASGGTRATAEVGEPSSLVAADLRHLFYVEARSELSGLAAGLAQRVQRAAADAVRRRLAPARAFYAMSAALRKPTRNYMRAFVNVTVVAAHNRAKIEVYRARGLTHVGIVPELKTTTRVGASDADTVELTVAPELRSGLLKRPAGGVDLDEVDVLTAGDDLVCEECQDIADGGPYELDEAVGLIPAHLNCRCAFVPALDKRFAHDAFNPDQPRGQPGNAGEFGPGVYGSLVAHGSPHRGSTLPRSHMREPVFPMGPWGPHVPHRHVRNAAQRLARIAEVDEKTVAHFLEEPHVDNILKSIDYRVDVLAKGQDRLAELTHTHNLFRHLIAASDIGADHLDAFVDHHPVLKHVTGPVLAALKFSIWVGNVASGDIDEPFPANEIRGAMFEHTYKVKHFVKETKLRDLLNLASHFIPSARFAGKLSRIAAGVLGAIIYSVLKKINPAHFETKEDNLLVNKITQVVDTPDILDAPDNSDFSGHGFDAFDPDQQRGQPGNAGQFGPGAGIYGVLVSHGQFGHAGHAHALGPWGPRSPYRHCEAAAVSLATRAHASARAVADFLEQPPVDRALSAIDYRVDQLMAGQKKLAELTHTSGLLHHLAEAGRVEVGKLDAHIAAHPVLRQVTGYVLAALEFSLWVSHVGVGHFDEELPTKNLRAEAISHTRTLKDFIHDVGPMDILAVAGNVALGPTIQNLARAGAGILAMFIYNGIKKLNPEFAKSEEHRHVVQQVHMMRHSLHAASIGDADWDESQHPRGQPGNAGQFGPGGGGGSKAPAEENTKPVMKEWKDYSGNARPYNDNPESWKTPEEADNGLYGRHGVKLAGYSNSIISKGTIVEKAREIDRTFDDLKGRFPGLASSLSPGLKAERNLIPLFSGIELVKGRAFGENKKTLASYNSQDKGIMLSSSLNRGEDKLKMKNAWTVSDTMAGILRHELGHAFEVEYNNAVRGKFPTSVQSFVKMRDAKTFVSQYAATNSKEHFAESFAAYTHPDYPSSKIKIDPELEKGFDFVMKQRADKMEAAE